jgi:ABC-type branched-subunit amino acid transport system permease subunit
VATLARDVALMRQRFRLTPLILQLALLLLLLAVPRVVQLSYLLDVVIVTALYVGLGLSYDLIVGHVGSLSLAQPAFYGIGAYSVALLSTRAHWSTVPALFAAALIAGLFALLVGVPSFRLSQYSFAIGTLGFATVAGLVAQNFVDLTDGPMCVTGVPKASIAGISFATLPSFYYFIVAIVIGIFLFTRRLIGSRIGRSFAAVRENEPLAAAIGINPLKYKLLAFSISAALAGVIGGVYAYYVNVVCPSELSLFITLNLLVILFIGGSGTVRGVVLGAITATTLPELLRLASTWRLLAFGVLLLLIINVFPDGLEGGLQRLQRQLMRNQRGSGWTPFSR